MEHLYIDESGSMTDRYIESNPYFVMAIVRAPNPDKLRTLHKRFVRKHMDDLRAVDTEGRMFKNGKFVELKGSMFTPSLKRDFVSYFCRENTLELFFIELTNSAISGGLYENTARAFNYVLKLALEYFIRNRYLPDDKYVIQLDERNERTETKHFLQNYLNTELRMTNTVSSDMEVRYFDSSCNRLIQIADVLANLYYSQLRTKAYSNALQQMSESGCLKFIFRFPPSTNT